MQLDELRHEQGKMAREKEVLENQLEAEQEYIVHKLQKQAAHIAAERQALQLEKGDLKRQVCRSVHATMCNVPYSLIISVEDGVATGRSRSTDAL